MYIWNLWSTHDNKLELDFDTGPDDIMVYGGNGGREVGGTPCTEPQDQGIKRCHDYKMSFRSYVSILYLNWPQVISNLNIII